MKVLLYTTGCPRCNVLEKKLDQKNIDYEKITEFDVQKFVDLGISSAPILQIDDQYKEYIDAVKWINEEA